MLEESFARNRQHHAIHEIGKFVLLWGKVTKEGCGTAHQRKDASESKSNYDGSDAQRHGYRIGSNVVHVSRAKRFRFEIEWISLGASGLKRTDEVMREGRCAQKICYDKKGAGEEKSGQRKDGYHGGEEVDDEEQNASASCDKCKEHGSSGRIGAREQFKENDRVVSCILWHNSSAKKGKCKNKDRSGDKDGGIRVGGHNEFLSNQFQTICERLKKPSNTDNVGSTATLDSSHDFSFCNGVVCDRNEKTHNFNKNTNHGG